MEEEEEEEKETETEEVFFMNGYMYRVAEWMYGWMECMHGCINSSNALMHESS